jgi:hypothetical protein
MDGLYTHCGRCQHRYAIPAQGPAKHTCPDGVTLPIHEPDPHYWLRPDTETLGRALILAEDQAKKTQVAHVVCAVVEEGEMGFCVYPNESYAALREKKLHTRLAPLCSVLPSGDIDVYEVIRGFVVGTPRDTP